jgi:hypothetical protein
MPTRYYRLTVLGCALSWFMVGLHFPVLHDVAEHGQSPPWSILAIVALLIVAGVASLWVLLRTPAPPSSRGPGAHAT